MEYIGTYVCDIGLLIVRLIIAYIFIPTGFKKIVAGPQEWLWLGSQMKHFGITYAPYMWGFAASCAELCGGISMLLGIGTRIFGLGIICVMVVALRMHIANGDSWRVWWWPLLLLLLCALVVFQGAGTFSLSSQLLSCEGAL